MSWQPVIGLEIHAQLATASKIFSGASTGFGAPPNTQACAVDLGLPGVLPVLNGEVVRMAVKFGLAISAQVSPRSVFERKNYFYPDLPKGYQISQYEHPIVKSGSLVIETEGGSKRVGITRAHLEEDAGKSLHEDFQGMTGVDLNRAGTPLLEIVSEPEMYSAKEAIAYMRAVHTLVRYLGICDGNMQEGSFRCDANVSLRPSGTKRLGTRTEIKNLNSFRFVERAIEHEIERQTDILERGDVVEQQTRLYDADRDETRAMRSKEEANDYRYFPDPDLLPVEVSESLLEEVRAELPELPQQKRLRFMSDYALGSHDADMLVASRELADFFEATVEAAGGEAKSAANWIIGDLTAALKRTNTSITCSPLGPDRLGGMIRRIVDGTISGKIAKEVFEAMWQDAGNADAVIEAKGLRQITDSSALEQMIDEIIDAHPEQTAEFRAGKHKVLGFFVGKVMQASQGKANPKQVNELLRKKL